MGFGNALMAACATFGPSELLAVGVNDFRQFTFGF
jgi:hypothetical protein